MGTATMLRGRGERNRMVGGQISGNGKKDEDARDRGEKRESRTRRPSVISHGKVGRER